MWPNSPAIPLCPESSCPLARTQVPTPSATATSTASRIPSMRAKVSSASRHAVASFSNHTGSPILVWTIFLILNSGHFKLGAKIIRCVAGFTLPGRLMPIPSIDLRGAVRCILCMQSMINRMESAGSEVSGVSERESRRPFRSTKATLACDG